MAVLAAGLGAVASGLGFFTSANYVKTVREAQVAVRIAGQESRATIEKADQAAQAVLGKMGNEVRSSIHLAQRKVAETLTLAGSETRRVIGETGIDARYTSEIMRIKVDQILTKAAREAEIVLATAGLETRNVIELGGQEARETCLLLSSEVNTQIREASQQATKVLKDGGLEIRGILDQVVEDTRALTEGVGREFENVIEVSLERAGRVLSATVDSVDQKLEGLIGQMGREANGLIINLGEQGRLLVQDTGQEIRACANKVLAKAFSGQQMIIKTAGAESRLTIQAVGKELRSTLYEVPVIAGLTAELVGRSFAFGLVDGFWGQGNGSRIVHCLKNLLSQPNGASIEEVIQYVSEQTQLPAEEKFALYKELVAITNNPAIEGKKREQLLIFIGVAALKDDGLKTVSLGLLYGRYERHYGEELIELIPGNAQAVLKTNGQDALERFLPEVVELPLIEPLDPLQVLVDQHKLELLDLRYRLENEAKKNQILELEKQAQQSSREEVQECLQETQNDALAAQQRIKELEEANTRLLDDVEFLKQERVKLKQQIDELRQILQDRR